LGGGDPFLFAGAGAWAGWMGLPSVLLWACAVGFSLVLTFMITRGKVSGTDRLPFGTFLCVGIWLTWLYGPLGVG
ncbi:MAG: prepilin peptidase, partial [Alphaproteobacteria bacterium]